MLWAGLADCGLESNRDFYDVLSCLRRVCENLVEIEDTLVILCFLADR